MGLVDYLWEGEGSRFICYKPQGEDRIRQKRFPDTDSALAFARQMAEHGADVWYGVGLFNDKRRAASDVKSLRAFYLDIDCGEKKPYSDAAEALQALKGFVTELGLPKPHIVSSGFGLHVYWLLDAPVDREAWLRVAERLRAACMSKGLKTDTTVTSDTARILRVPGTYNFKRADAPRPVEELTKPNTVSYADFAQKLMAVAAAIPLERRVKKATMNTEFVAESYPPSSAPIIAEKCHQVRFFRDQKGNVSEPLWHAVLGILKHTVEGDAIAHEWSSGHPEYDAGDTQARLDRLEAIGPSTCARLSGINPDGCLNCPHLNNITSPIQLGIKVDEIQAPPPEVKVPSVRLGRYQIGEQGVLMEDDEGMTKTVLDYPLWIEAMFKTESGNGGAATIIWRDAQKHWQHAEFPLKVLADTKELKKFMYDHMITGHHDIKQVQMYLHDAANAKNAEIAPGIMRLHFGWDSAMVSFAVGSVAYTRTGAEKVTVSRAINELTKNQLQPAGDAARWTEATRVFNDPRLWAQAFSILVALSAPMYRLMGVPGAVLSLTGKSGTGKTVSSDLGLAAWGHPQAMRVSASGSVTPKIEKMRMLNSLPAMVDETSKMAPHALSELIYMAANGQAKDRAQREGGLKDPATWNLPLIITTNKPVMEYDLSDVGEAERRRIIELTVTEAVDRDTGRMLNEVAYQHYGHIAAPLMQALQGEREMLIGLTQQVADMFAKKFGIPDQNRFGLWMCTSAAVVGLVAQALGLIAFDVQSPIVAVLKVLAESATDTVEEDARAEDVLAAYINTHQANFNIKQNGIYTQESRGEVAALYDETEGMLYIPVRLFKQYCMDAGLSWSQTAKWRKERSIKAAAKRLGKVSTPEHSLWIPHNNNQGNRNDD